MSWRLVALVFAPFGAGYFLSYVLRNINAVLSKPLSAELSLTASDLGLLTSVYFLAFAAFQLPLGILLDRFGPRKVQSGLMLFAALGALVFSFSESIFWLTVGRALMGLGTAGALMSGFKAIAIWFPKDYFAKLNGLMFSIGGLGAIVAAGPVEFMLRSMVWRDIFWWVAIVTTIVSLVIFFVVPKRSDTSHITTASLKEQIAVMLTVARDPVFLRLCPLLVMCSGTAMALLGLWAAPFLRDVAGLGAASTGEVLTLMAITTALGSGTSGFIVAWANRWGFTLEQVLGVGALGALLMLTAVASGVAKDWPLIWLVFGFFATGTQMSYARFAAHFGPAKAGRANAVANVFLFGLGSFGIQYCLGIGLDFWDKPTTANAVYSEAAYSFVFSIITILLAITWIWFWKKGGMKSET